MRVLKSILLLAAMLWLPAAAVASYPGKGDQWQDPGVNQINRLPMHTNYFAYESAEMAAENRREVSANYLSLNGIWKFNWVADADRRPVDFWRPGYDDKGWGIMKVPAVWELNGYGDPIYVNVGYAWRNQYKSEPPFVPVEKNHVGSYRREIDVPADWNGKQIIARFGSVTSNIYLWVNGNFVGYSEDSKLEAEFDVTKYIKPGKNLFAFQVFRWCDGTYLEDQDFFRFSGVGRDCYLYAREKTRIQDIRITPDLDALYTDGTLDIEMKVEGQCQVVLSLTDAGGNEVASRTLAGKPNMKTTLEVKGPEKWNAESPYLYTLTATTVSKGKVVEVIPQKVGFRKIELTRGQVLVNGEPVLFKGVNRHEMDPNTGYVVSRERMLNDIEVLKKFNINAVRTCHYPDDNMWYDLCDEYGLYVVAEANIESHGMGYGEGTLAKNPLYAKMHLERNQRNVQRSFNRPSVIFWSMGNEAGFGPAFEECYKWIKNEDPSRPVQYEQAHGNEFTDIFCPMYYRYSSCEKYSAGNPGKPLIMCEYAHAMGNSMGGFKEYWDLVRKYPAFQGAFIWDFADQSIWWNNKHGMPFLAYGGDFNPYDASDRNFCNNGIFRPDRLPHPHAYEVKYYYQNIWTEPKDLSKGVVTVTNENFFIGLDDYYMSWTLLVDGRAKQGGRVEKLDIPAKQSRDVVLAGFDAAGFNNGEEVLLNVSYLLKNEKGMLPANFETAKQQLTVKAYENKDIDALLAQGAGEVRIDGKDWKYAIISGENFRIEFNKHNGFLTSYIIDGIQMIDDGDALRPNFWRAPTDNDRGARTDQKYAVWRDPGLKLKSFDVVPADVGVRVSAVYEMGAVPAELSLMYYVNAEGAVRIDQRMKAKVGTDVPNLYRFGMRMHMPESFDAVEYYGRGPVENYSDRKSSQDIGLYRQTVTGQYDPYLRPQENGTKSDVREWNIYNHKQRGLKIIASVPFSASALHYSQETLSRGWDTGQYHPADISPEPLTSLCIDKVQSGLACEDSWGALPRPEYQLPFGDYEFSFILMPYRRN